MNDHDLRTFVEAVDRRVTEIVDDAPLSPDQRRILRHAVGADDRREDNPLRHSLAPFYLLVRALGGDMRPALRRLGAGMLLAQRCMGLIDDVEDDELSTQQAVVDPIVAINSGLALYLFAIDELRAAEFALGFGCAGPSPWRSLLAHALRLCRAQHADIVGRGRPRTTDDAVALATDKSSYACALAETAALCVDSTGNLAGHATAIGEALACIQQIVDDVADLFGPGRSADLRTGTWTAPIAFLHDALSPEERAPFIAAMTTGSLDQRRLGRMIFDSGAMQRVAEVLERERTRLQDALAAVAVAPAYAATLTAWVDDLLAVVYRPAPAPAELDIVRVDEAGMSQADAQLHARLRVARTRTLAHRPSEVAR